VQHLVEWFEESEGMDLRGDTMALQRLKDASEKAKCDLSMRDSVEINLPFIASDSDGPRHLNYELSRETLEALVGDVVEGTLKSVEQCCVDAGVQPQDIDQVVLVGGQSRMPLVQKRVTEHFGKRPHKGVNPDEVVGLGAAVQAAALLDSDNDMLLLDVTPLSLGIGTYGGHFARLIERNTTVPVNKGHVFTTTRDDQSGVKIRVLQGESDMASENDLLGEFVLSGIRPAPKGEPEIEVSFDIDANGIVSVGARDLATGKEQSITVSSTGTLSDTEIGEIIQEHDLYEVELKG
jgi:molecular chaperone DnaK